MSNLGNEKISNGHYISQRNLPFSGGEMLLKNITDIEMGGIE